MVDALGLGPCGETLGGSSPLIRTKFNTMAKSLIEKQSDGTIKLTITISKETAVKAQEAAIAAAVKQADIPGFRKGTAPKKVVEEKLNKDKLKEDTLRDILPAAYQEAVLEHNIRPIMNPKIHVDALEEGKDWVFEALTCEAPTIEVGDYKKGVKEVTAKSKIIIPGKASGEAGSSSAGQKPAFEDIAKAILEVTTAKIPSILIDQETDRLLAQLLDDIKKLGLNLEQYLASTKRTPDDLRNEYAKRATDDMTLEFVLQKIAEQEKITVEDKEIEEAIQKAKSPAEKQNLEGNRYLLAAILRQQKTLDFLMGL